MKTQSKPFLFEKNIPWEPAGEGVTRQIMGYDGQVMLVKVKFETGAQGYSHTHYHSQTTYVASGRFQFTIGEENRIVETGDGLYMEPDIQHSCQCLEAGTLIDCFTPMRADFLKKMKAIRPTIFLLILSHIAQPLSAEKAPEDQQLRKKVEQTMKKATRFMMEKVSRQGGFVWTQLPDKTRSWGELEAYPTTVWVQSPGTPSVGQTLLDAWEATKDPYYLKAAYRVADALKNAQLPCGGWNYLYDLAGEASLKQWYATIGRSAWRLEEFHQYQGNATFDDGTTTDAGLFLLRLYLTEQQANVKTMLDKVVDLVLKSQQDGGGWPQRYPPVNLPEVPESKDYSRYTTLNDGVHQRNTEFLLYCSIALNKPELKEYILKAMHGLRDLQQPQPRPGWADQYDAAGKPAQARSYEPAALNTTTSLEMAGRMMDYYQWTGDASFLKGVPAVLDWLESLKLSDSTVYRSGKRPMNKDILVAPRFIDPEDGKPLYVHRKGTNAYNGTYYVNQDIRNTIAHYSSQAFLNTRPYRERHEKLCRMTVQEATIGSPFNQLGNPQADLVTLLPGNAFSKKPDRRMPVEHILASFKPEGYWPSQLTAPSWPYKGQGTAEGAKETKYAETFTGDIFDTSCSAEPLQVECITLRTYNQCMRRLALFLETGE